MNNLLTLSKMSQISIAICSSAYFIVGVNFLPLIVVVLIPVGIFGFYLILRNPEYSLYLIIFSSVVANSRMVNTEQSGIKPLDIVVALILVTITAYYILRIKFIERTSLAKSVPHLLLFIYVLWTLLVGIFSLTFWHNSAELIIRDLLIQLSLVTCTILIAQYFTKDRIYRLITAMTVAWMLTILVNILKYRSNVVQAVYLFETGRSSIDLTISTFGLFMFIAAAMYLKRPKNIFLMLGASLSVFVIIISMFRTIWLMDLVLIAAMFIFFSSREDRQNGRRFFGLVLISLLICTGILILNFSFAFPLIKLFFYRFLYSSAITVDPSLVNRYIEWRTIWKSISLSPIIGFGYGSQYLNYNWISGVSYYTGYTHNGYLFLLFHSGFIGILLIGISYILFIIKGLTFFRLLQTEPVLKAFLVAGILILIGNLAGSMTLNALAQRDGMLWSSIIIGYILFITRHLKSNAEILPKIIKR